MTKQKAETHTLRVNVLALEVEVMDLDVLGIEEGELGEVLVDGVA